jgi:hypothetical protein
MISKEVLGSPDLLEILEIMRSPDLLEILELLEILKTSEIL